MSNDENNELDLNELDNTDSDENLESSLEEVKQEQDTIDEDPEVIKAKQHGWDPNKGNKTAREFNLTGELIDLKKTVQKRDRDIEEILKYHESTVESQKQSYRKQLEQAIQQAKLEGDADQIEQLTQQRIELNQRDAVSKQEQTQRQIKACIEDFMARNSHWYNNDHPELKSTAERLEADILNGVYEQETGIPKPATYEGVLKQIEREMKRNAPDIVNTSGVSRPSISSVKSSINKTSEATSGDDSALFNKLDSSEKAMYEALKRMNKKAGIDSYSVKEFIKEARNQREI